jgi:hypothetical protein
MTSLAENRRKSTVHVYRPGPCSQFPRTTITVCVRLSDLVIAIASAASVRRSPAPFNFLSLAKASAKRERDKPLRHLDIVLCAISSFAAVTSSGQACAVVQHDGSRGHAGRQGTSRGVLCLRSQGEYTEGCLSACPAARVQELGCPGPMAGCPVARARARTLASLGRAVRGARPDLMRCR